MFLNYRKNVFEVEKLVNGFKQTLDLTMHVT